MTRRWPILGAALILTALLAGCSALGPRFDVVVSMDPPVLGFEVSEDAIEIVANAITFISKPGSIGGWIEGYSVSVYDEVGTLILPATPGPRSEVLGARVLPGISCATSDPCSFTSPDQYPQEQVSEPRSGVVTLDAMNAAAIWAADGRGYAEITFSGTTDRLEPFEIVRRVDVTFPVGE